MLRCLVRITVREPLNEVGVLWSGAEFLLYSPIYSAVTDQPSQFTDRTAWYRSTGLCLELVLGVILRHWSNYKCCNIHTDLYLRSIDVFLCILH